MNEVLKQVDQAISDEIKKNQALQYQMTYLKSSLQLKHLKPATGFLRERQMESLALAKQIIPILQKAHFTPMLSGHSLLGAKRHEGFIPWESNMQFTLMSQDFWRLENFIKKEYKASMPTSSIFWFESKHTQKKHDSQLSNHISKQQNKSPLQTEEINARIAQIEKNIEINALAKFASDPFDTFTTLSEAINTHNNVIFAMRTPFSIVFYKGTSIENSVRVEFVPYYFLDDLHKINHLITQRKAIKDFIQKVAQYALILHFFDELLKTNSLYNLTPQNITSSTNKQITLQNFENLPNFICPGINNHEFIRKNTNFQQQEHKQNILQQEQARVTSKISSKISSDTYSEDAFPIFEKSDFFPLKSIAFETELFYTFNQEEHYLSTLFGDYTHLPKNVGISPYYVALNVWLRDNKRRLLPITEATLI